MQRSAQTPRTLMALVCVSLVASPAVAQRVRHTRAATSNTFTAPLVLEEIDLGFHCGNCASDPQCQQRWIASVRPRWDAQVQGGSSRQIHISYGSFGTPGTALHGDAWRFYLVMPPSYTTSGPVQVQVGSATTSSTLGLNEFGSMQGSVLVFRSQLSPGTHTITVTSPTGTVLFSHRAEFLAITRP